MADFLIGYWWILVALVAAVSLAVAFVVRFINTPTDQQMLMVKNWLLQAVVQAEKEFGGKTGSIKLSYVYNAFVSTFPKLAMVISFEMFSSLVDDVLEKFRNMLESNTTLHDYVYGEEIPLG